MPDPRNQDQTIHVGDTVTYRLSGGGSVLDVRGKVLGLFNTRDGQTLADVEWDRLGPPKRLNINNLTKV